MLGRHTVVDSDLGCTPAGWDPQCAAPCGSGFFGRKPMIGSNCSIFGVSYRTPVAAHPVVECQSLAAPWWLASIKWWHPTAAGAFELRLFSPTKEARKVSTMPPSATLPTRPLGKNGPLVPRLGLGLMNGGGGYGQPPSDEERMAFLDQAIELGETFWDTGQSAARRLLERH